MCERGLLDWWGLELLVAAEGTIGLSDNERNLVTGGDNSLKRRDGELWGSAEDESHSVFILVGKQRKKGSTLVESLVAQKIFDAGFDLITNRSNGCDVLGSGIGIGQSMRWRPGTGGQSSPHPIVMRAFAVSTSSWVSFWDETLRGRFPPRA